MAQTYTIDEAAERLGIPADEFKRKLKDEWKSIRSFRDGPTLRFRAADIDELARSLGEASDPGLQFGGTASPGSDEFLVPPDATPIEPEPESLSGDDIFSLAGQKKPKSGSDSDVRLEARGPRTDDSSEGSVPTEEIALDLSGPDSKSKTGGSSARLRAPKSGPNLSGPGSKSKIPGPPPSSAEPMSTDSSSEFELSLDADSGSFELQLSGDSSEEVEIGSPVLPPGGRGAQSGINLARPTDSGVSLENRPGSEDDDSDDFELSLDPADSGPHGKPVQGPPSKRIPQMASDSDSEFELTLDDNSGVTDGLAAELAGDDGDKRDIFETDFELPASDDSESGSEVIAVGDSDTDLENSDFDLALDESDASPVEEDDSGSEVVALEDSDEAPVEEEPSTRRRGAAAAAGAAVGAAAGRRKSRPADDEDEDDESDAASELRDVDRGDDRPGAAVDARPAEWSGWVLIPLALAFVLTFLGGIVTMESLRGMTGYTQGSKPGAFFARTIADNIGMEIKD